MITLTVSERATLVSMRTQARNNTIGYWQIYQWLEDLLVSNYEVEPTDSTLLWLRGATEANAGRGMFSSLIRAYTETQSLLRYGISQAASMQAASDGVAENLLKDLLGENPGWPAGNVPDISRIASADATAVGNVLFNANINDTAAELQQNSAWSGALLFSLLNSNQTERLISTGNSSASIDSVNDWRDVLFSFISYREGLKAAGLSLAAQLLAEDTVQTATDLSILGTTIFGYLEEAGQTYSDIADTLPITTNAVLQEAFEQIDEYGSRHVLDWLNASVLGYSTSTVTTDSTLDAHALAFANIIGVQGQGWSAELITNAATILATAQGSGNEAIVARNALKSLSPFVVDGEGLNLSSRGLSLYNAETGVGELREEWLEARAKMLQWCQLYDVNDVAYGTTLDITIIPGVISLPLPVLGDAEFQDRASGIVRGEALLQPLRAALADMRSVLEPRPRFDAVTAQITWQVAAADYAEYGCTQAPPCAQA